MGYEYRTIMILDTSTTADDTTGSSGAADKIFTVPTNRYYRIVSMVATLVSFGTVGNRVLQLTINGDTTIAGMDTEPFVDIRAGAVQAASLTRYYTFAPNVARLTAFADTDFMSIPIPDMELPPGSVIRVFDNAGVGDTAAPDDLELHIMFEARGGIA